MGQKTKKHLFQPSVIYQGVVLLLLKGIVCYADIWLLFLTGQVITYGLPRLSYIGLFSRRPAPTQHIYDIKRSSCDYSIISLYLYTTALSNVYFTFKEDEGIFYFILFPCKLNDDVVSNYLVGLKQVFVEKQQ